MQEGEFVHTLSFDLDIRESEPADLRETAIEARQIRNEVNRSISKAGTGTTSKI
jgi:hypothetical protein